MCRCPSISTYGLCMLCGLQASNKRLSVGWNVALVLSPDLCTLSREFKWWWCCTTFPSPWRGVFVMGLQWRELWTVKLKLFEVIWYSKKFYWPVPCLGRGEVCFKGADLKYNLSPLWCVELFTMRWARSGMCLHYVQVLLLGLVGGLLAGASLFAWNIK